MTVHAAPSPTTPDPMVGPLAEVLAGLGADELYRAVGRRRAPTGG